MGEVSPEELRAAFPLLHDIAYLNAGTCGPVSEAAVKAQAAALMTLLVQPRSRAYFDRTLDLMDRQRAAYAQRLGAAPADVALTTSTSEGVVRVLAALDLGPGDEIVTSDEEHPGVLGPLAAARARTGVQVRMVPLADVADAVGPATRLVACSHVGWTTGAVAPAMTGGSDGGQAAAGPDRLRRLPGVAWLARDAARLRFTVHRAALIGLDRRGGARRGGGDRTPGWRPRRPRRG